MPVLSLHVRSGLCNRLRPILSAIAYCQLTGRDLRIHWPRVDSAEKGGGGIFDATLRDLFDHPFEEVTEAQHNATGRLVRQTEISLKTVGDLHMRTINMFPGVEPPEGFPRKHESHAFLASRRHYEKPLADYWSVMKPSAEVEHWIVEGRQRIAGRPCVAAIIRYALRNPNKVDVSTAEKLNAALMAGLVETDHNFETDKRSDVSAYVARMKAYPPETVFFLATDCQYIEDIVRDALGTERIVNLPQTYRYDRETILKRAAEMYIAAQECREILGAYISSYAEFAGWLAGGQYSACYLWPRRPGETYFDMGSYDFATGETTAAHREMEALAAEARNE